MVDYTTKLASTITGEASGDAGQFGVAATMLNRIKAGIDTPSSLLSVGSFEANNKFTTPSPYALQLAQGVQSGDLSQFGSTGNATYYNGPGGSSYGVYSTGSGNNIAGNAYSDRYNQAPSSNFQAPTMGASQPPAIGQGTSLANGLSPADQDALEAQGINPATGAKFTAADDASQDAAQDAGPFAGSGTPTNSIMTPQPSPSASSEPTDTSALSSAAGGGFPLQITDASNVGQQAGQNVQAGLNKASGSIDNGVKAVDQTAAKIAAGAATTSTGLLGSAESALTDIGIRAGILAVALLLLAGAWVFYAKGDGSNGSVTIVPV